MNQKNQRVGVTVQGTTVYDGNLKSKVEKTTTESLRTKT